MKTSIAETFAEEFAKRPWKSRQLQALAAGEPVPPRFPRKRQPTPTAQTQPSVRPYWTYDGDYDDTERGL